MYESRTYDDQHGEPVVVLVTRGQHDVSRLVHTLNGAPPVIEQIGLGLTVVRQLKRHNSGRVAVALLKAHGGADFTDQQSPTDPAALGAWLRALPTGTILRDAFGCACQRGTGFTTHWDADGTHSEETPFPALLMAGSDVPLGIEHGEQEPGGDLTRLAPSAPFTVLALGEDQAHEDDTR